jgi:hypothetical protein
MTLAQICEKHAPRDIHFLKIDVGGYEGKVLKGMDFSRFRPWVVIVEARQPMRPEAEHTTSGSHMYSIRVTFLLTPMRSIGTM